MYEFKNKFLDTIHSYETAYITLSERYKINISRDLLCHY